LWVRSEPSWNRTRSWCHPTGPSDASPVMVANSCCPPPFIRSTSRCVCGCPDPPIYNSQRQLTVIRLNSERDGGISSTRQSRLVSYLSGRSDRSEPVITIQEIQARTRRAHQGERNSARYTVARSLRRTSVSDNCSSTIHKRDPISRTKVSDPLYQDPDHGSDYWSRRHHGRQCRLRRVCWRSCGW